ncbi:hypothetical protein CDL15_Pgr015838 [Punica granatum]|uniref:3-hydroxyisobutyryl-CoA hydrolase n=1 Tax=Punica granatum TaxID=22663 RepID=A0A218XRB3_PUNGR|nr:hypothetical protein CDL15_Pgr015838 [Punica granatum]
MLEERLGKLVTDDASIIEKALAQYCDFVYPDKRSIIWKIGAIDKCFCHDTIEEIIHAVWSPPSLGEVTEEMVDFYFCTLEESELELKLLTALREPSV